MKKKGIIILVIIVLIILVIIGLFVFNKPRTNNANTKIEQKNDPIKFYDIQYSITKSSYCSCLTFLKNNKFSEYDCDSEPTSMPFAGEFYDKYYFNSNENTIIFKGKGEPDMYAKVLEWTDKTLLIKVINSKNNDPSCAIDGKNTYRYYSNNN